MRNLWRIFFKAEGASPWVTVFCLLGCNLAEGIGLASLLPLLAVATDSESNSPLFIFVREAFAAIGLPLAVGPLILFVVGAVVVSSCLRLLAMRYVGFAEAEVSTRLRLKLTNLLIAARWNYYVSQSFGRINHALFNLTGTAGNAYSSAARFLALVIETVIVTAVAFMVSLEVTAVGLVIGLGVARVLHWFVRRSRKAGKKGSEQQLALAVLWNNTLGNLKPLKAMARHMALFRMFERQVLQLRNTVRRQVMHREARNSFQEILMALLLGIGSYLALVVWGVPVVELIVVGVVLSRAVKGIGKMQAQYQLVAVNEFPYIELQEFMREVASAHEPNPGRRSVRLERGCALEDVTFSYGRGPVLDRVSVEVPFGQVTVLTGPSGAGKTTISDLLLGLHRPQAGRVLVDGVSLEEIDLQSWRRQIGYVPQELVLFYDTVFGNVQLGDPAVSTEDVEQALRTAGAWDFIGALPEGLSTVVGDAGARMSGGQRQRIALARAIVTRPRLLVLDEVTSALDPETERLMCANVRRLAKDAAILAITHRPAFLDIADTVYEVVDGRARRLPAAGRASERRGSLVAGSGTER